MTFGEQNTEKEAHEMLSYAFEHGINALDTAEAVSSLVCIYCRWAVFVFLVSSLSFVRYLHSSV